MIDGLKSIVVRSFEFEQEGAYKIEDLNPIREQLRAPGWSRILNVREPNEIVEVFLRNDQGKVAGLAILAAEKKELTVVLIDGTIDLATLAQMGGQFGIPKGLPIPGTQNPAPQPAPGAKGKEE